MERTVTFAGDTIAKQIQSYYQKTLEKLAHKLDTDIVMCLCHGRQEHVPTEMSFDKLYIFIQLLPREFEGVEKTNIKGYKIGGKEILFPVKSDSPQPCPQGDSLKYKSACNNAQIISDDNNDTMAVIYDGAIYVLNDFIHSRSKEELDISMVMFNHIVKETIDKTDLVRQLKSGIEEKSKRVLASTLKVNFSQRLEKEQIQLRAAKDTISQYEKGIVDATRKVMSGEKIVEAIKNNIADIPTALDKTWESLQRMNNTRSYTSITFTKTGIIATTSPISIDYNGKKYYIGKFEVKMGFDGTTLIYNLDNRSSTFDHPHVSNGQVCWGNFAGWIPKLIGSCEFDVALDQIFTFLCHYDAASPYQKIENWPQPKKKETKVSSGMADTTDAPSTMSVRN